MSKEIWTYTLDMNTDTWNGGLFNSKEEAIKEAVEEAKYNNDKQFKVGLCEEVFNYGIDVDDLLERISDNVYEEVGEVAEDYLDDVTKEHRDELEDNLNKVFREWQEKYKYKPSYYNIISEEVININK